MFGPRQIIARINQDQVISPQITLWNQQGSEVNQGTLLVIPIEESLLYVRPLYLRSAGGRIPELKRVIVAYQSQIVMDETLNAALDRIFGRGAAQRLQPSSLPPVVEFEPAFSESTSDLIALAREHYQRAMQALRDADFAAYGEEIKALGDVLDKLAPQAEPPKPPAQAQPPKPPPTRPVPR